MLGPCQRVDAGPKNLHRQRVDLAQRTREPSRELGQRRLRVGLEEPAFVRGAGMELPQANHALVLVAKATEVGVAQRC